MARKKSTKKKENPIIAVAMKIIPGKYIKGTGRFIRKHKKTIFLTVGGIAALWGLYLQRKYRFQKRLDENRLKMHRQMLEIDLNTTKILSQGPKIKAAARLMNESQAEISKAIRDMNNQQDIAELALMDKTFRDYLKKEHNIEDIRRVKK